MHEWNSIIFIIDFEQIFFRAKFSEKLIFFTPHTHACLGTCMFKLNNENIRTTPMGIILMFLKHSNNVRGHYSNVLLLTLKRLSKSFLRHYKVTWKSFNTTFLTTEISWVIDYFPYWFMGTNHGGVLCISSRDS